MRPPVVPEQPVPVLTDDQIRTLLAGCACRDLVSRRDEAIIRLFMDTGARRAKIENLTVEDVDFTQDVIHIVAKGRRARAVPFGTGQRPREAGPAHHARRMGSMKIRLEGSDRARRGHGCDQGVVPGGGPSVQRRPDAPRSAASGWRPRRGGGPGRVKPVRHAPPGHGGGPVCVRRPWMLTFPAPRRSTSATRGFFRSSFALLSQRGKAGRPRVF
ncbi:tyrosine-type recombinase/integrase [Frankia sp. BMG5.23]|uniref:tyrosine-type recombinase/integrase n=1 Tax=Frankia sp. BMG5.23 TaxID=683305 RepID=UPI0034CD1F34